MIGIKVLKSLQVSNALHLLYNTLLTSTPDIHSDITVTSLTGVNCVVHHTLHTQLRKWLRENYMVGQCLVLVKIYTMKKAGAFDYLL